MNILIIDDHPLVSEGLAGLVKELDSNAVVTTIGSAQRMLEVIYESEPDLILLDLHMPDMNGFDALAILGERLPATPVVVISGSQETSDMQRVIAAGAMGYVPKSASPEIMLQALRLVMSGGIYIPPEMLNISSAASMGKTAASAPAAVAQLTPRQVEVLHLLSEGKVNKEIARSLDCAETTVKAHVTAIFKELKARNRTEAVINAQRQGLLNS